MARTCRGAAVVLAIVATMSACTGGDGGDTSSVTVAAASSWTDVAPELGDAFEDANPGTTVRFTLGSSAVLATQIVEGAPASVFVAADASTMARVAEAGLARSAPVDVARNRLALVARRDLDPPISRVEDLPAAGVVALCAPEAPCGALADRVLARAGVELAAAQVSRAPNARATLRAVSDGDADAALVYATDARAAPDAVQAATLPPQLQASTAYPAAVVGDEATSTAARFVDFLTSDAAQRVLADHGFEAP